MATSKISWIHCLLQFGYILAAVTAQEGCMMETFDDDGMINIIPPNAYYQRNNERNMYCWMIELPQNSNANDFIRINITYVSLRVMDGLCFDTFSITEVCGNRNKTEILEEICSCSGNCNSPISWSASLGCDLKVLLAKGSRNGRNERFGFDVNFSLDSLVSNTPSSTTNAPNLSTSLNGKQTEPVAKFLVTVLIILIMILVVALSVALFIRYYRRQKRGDKVASSTTYKSSAYSQNDVITSESHVESQLSDRNVRTETVNENPEISHSERLHGDNVEFNPLYIAENEPNTHGQVDNVAYQSVDEANQNPHEYTYIDLESSKGKQEECKKANQGQTSHVTNVTDWNDSSNPVEPPDESKYYYIEPRIH